MSIKILWYLTAPDGPFPWEPQGRWHTDFRHLQQLASTIDRLGYYGALLGTGLGDEVLTISSAMIGVTKRLRFLAAIHPGLLSPVKLAQIALTQDRLSGGRMIFNVVNGNDHLLPAFGVNYAHDERYDFSFEYWDAFRRFYLGQRDGYDGQFVKLAPAPAEYGLGRRGVREAPLIAVQPDGVPLWGAGTSAAGVAHSVQLLDTYLSFADTPPKLGEKFDRVGAEAAKIGRTLDYGTRLQIIVRETEEEAWAHAQWLLDHTHIDYARQSIEIQLPRGETLETYRSPDPQVERNLAAVRAGRLPKARDLEIYPNVWVGPSLFGFNILAPLAGTAIVGSARNVATRLQEYAANGAGAFILSGYPLISEAQRFADLVFPLLDLDHGFDVPLFGSRSRQSAVT
ncbi:MAG TPA: LLM class flavin-dependent oxidoreductase [Sphingobium sp.]